LTSGRGLRHPAGTAASINGGTDKEKSNCCRISARWRPEVISIEPSLAFRPCGNDDRANIIEGNRGPMNGKSFFQQYGYWAFLQCRRITYVTHEDFVAIAQSAKIPPPDAQRMSPGWENLLSVFRVLDSNSSLFGRQNDPWPSKRRPVCWRRILIAAAKLNHSPHEAPYRAPMKVNK